MKVVAYPEGTGKAGATMVVEFELFGQRIVAINGGPHFTFDEAISLQINCRDQAELDYYWEKLTDGGSEGACGWCKDRYGLSWRPPATASPSRADSRNGGGQLGMSPARARARSSLRERTRSLA